VALPTGWMDTTLGEIAETKLGKPLDAAKNKGEPTPYLGNISVRWGSFVLDNLRSMPVTIAELGKLAVRDGDLFVCEGGVPVRCAVWRHGEKRIVFQKAVHRIRPAGNVSPDYVQHFLAWSAARAAFNHLLTGTTIKHLPQVGLQRLVLPLPPVAEQRRIVAKLGMLTAGLAPARAELVRVAVIARRSKVAYAYQIIHSHSWPTVPFLDACDAYQPRTISKAEMVAGGGSTQSTAPTEQSAFTMNIIMNSLSS
jgi:type I restriction enzyme S subunit